VVNEVINVRTVEASANTFSFGFFAFLMLTSWVAMAVVTSVGDAICFELLGNFIFSMQLFHILNLEFSGSKPENYGRQRVWGSIGWGIFSMLAGYLVDETSKGRTEKNYSVVFYMTLAIIFIDLIVSSKIKVSYLSYCAVMFFSSRNTVKC